MKKILVIQCLILILGVLFFACTQNNESKFHQLKYPYLTQKPPGMKRELFAPGIISQAGFVLHSSLTFTPRGNEIYFSKLVREKNHYIGLMLKLLIN